MTCAATFPGIKETISVHRGCQSISISMKVDNIVVRTFILQSEFVENLKVEVAHVYIEQPPCKTYAVITFLAATALASFARVSETVPPLLLIASAVVMALATVYFVVKASGSSSLQQSEARESAVKYLRGLVKYSPERIKDPAFNEVLLPEERKAIYNLFYRQICEQFDSSCGDVNSQEKCLNDLIKRGVFTKDMLEVVYTDCEAPPALSELAEFCEAYSKFKQTRQSRFTGLEGKHKRNLRTGHVPDCEKSRAFFIQKIESESGSRIKGFYEHAKLLVQKGLWLKENSTFVPDLKVIEELPTLEHMLPDRENVQHSRLHNYIYRT